MEITRFHIIGSDPEGILARFPDEKGHIVIQWEKEFHSGFPFEEFGQIVLAQKKDGSITIDAECMSAEFVKSILCTLVDKAKFVG